MTDLPAQLSGIVTRYKGNGRKLGYPTANIHVQTDLADGVYFGFADLADRLQQPALIFIGVPTTMGDTERRVEAHVLGLPDIDYYGKELSLRVEVFHRANKTFASIDELLAVMHDDEAQARTWFAQQA